MDKGTMKEMLAACMTETTRTAFQGVGVAIRAKWKSPRDSIGMETLAQVFEELSGDVKPEEPKPVVAKKPRTRKVKDAPAENAE